jgi:hypothetical protein
MLIPGRGALHPFRAVRRDAAFGAIYAVDTVVCLIFNLLGFHVTRVK